MDKCGWLLTGTAAGYINIIPLASASSKAAASFVGLTGKGAPILRSSGFALSTYDDHGIGEESSKGNNRSELHKEHRVTHNNNYYVSSSGKKSGGGSDVQEQRGDALAIYVNHKR